MHNDLLSRIEKKITRTINQKHAYDFDGTGIGWNKFENNPVLSDEHGGSLFDPFVRRINGKYMMGVSNRRTKSVELYESIEGTLWKKIGVAITGIPTSEWEKDVNRAKSCLAVSEIFRLFSKNLSTVDKVSSSN